MADNFATGQPSPLPADPVPVSHKPPLSL